MKKIINKSKNILRYSKSVQDIISKIPSATSELQEIAMQAASTIHRLKVDADAVITDLKSENEEQFGEVLREVTLAQERLLDCGYSLEGAHLDLGSIPVAWSVGKPALEIGRLTIRLKRCSVSAEPPSLLPSDTKTLRALFFAIDRANDLATKVLIFGLVPDEILVTVGALPSLRIVWKNTATTHGESAEDGDLSNPPQASLGASWSLGYSGGFFPPKKPAPPTIPLPESFTTSEPPPTPQDQEAILQQKPTSPPDPLAKFKKMPDLGKSHPSV
jgi:hypothetical protein